MTKQRRLAIQKKIETSLIPSHNNNLHVKKTAYEAITKNRPGLLFIASELKKRIERVQK